MDKVAEIRNYLSELNLQPELANWLYLERLLETETIALLSSNIEASTIRHYFQVVAYFNYHYFTEYYSQICVSLSGEVEIDLPCSSKMSSSKKKDGSKKNQKLIDWLFAYSLLQVPNLGTADLDIDMLKEHTVIYIKHIRPCLLSSLNCLLDD